MRDWFVKSFFFHSLIGALNTSLFMLPHIETCDDIGIALITDSDFYKNNFVRGKMADSDAFQLIFQYIFNKV